MSSEKISERVPPMRSSCLQWVPTDAAQLEAAERLMLESIQYVQRRVAGVNTISSRVIDDTKDHVVLLHGFAGGLACWVQNWAAIAAVANVHAIDVPGFARSDRPTRDFRKPVEALDFFFGYLDRWFDEMNLSATPVVLVGHSFGGYISARYAMARGPARVRHLVLADPWGVPKASEADDPKHLPLKFRAVLKIFQSTNPLGVLRGSGPLGPKLLPKVRPDFAERWTMLKDPMVFYDYTFHCNAQYPPTGEIAFKACCHGKVMAREPLQTLVPDELSRETMLTVMYGSHTWMRPEAGRDMVETVVCRGHANAEIHTIPEAGHQLNTDNAAAFNDRIVAAILRQKV